MAQQFKKGDKVKVFNKISWSEYIGEVKEVHNDYLVMYDIHNDQVDYESEMKVPFRWWSVKII